MAATSDNTETTAALPSVAALTRGAAFREKVALARQRGAQCAKEYKAAEEARTAAEEERTERWSGLRIEKRCVRQEKWHASMRGKELVSFSNLHSLSPAGRSQVVIGVLYSRSAGPQWTPDARQRFAEWQLTDLKKEAQSRGTLVLVNAALEHWATAEGFGYAQATVGSIFAFLNPEPVKRSGAFRVSVESQVLKLGTCPNLGLCSAKTQDGRECGAPLDLGCSGGDSAGLCVRHAGMSMYARAREMDGPTTKSKRSRLAG